MSDVRRLLFRLTAALVRPSTASLRAAPHRVLVVKPDHLGDLLLATPALRALRNGLPTAHVTGLVSPSSQRIWQGLSSLDELQTLEFPGFQRGQRRAGRLQLLYQTVQAARRVRQGRFDAALLLRDDDYWSALVCTLAGVPRRIGHAHPRLVDLLTDSVPYAAQRHVTRQALDVVTRLIGPLSTLPALELLTDAAEMAWAAERLPQPALTVICHPGTGGAAKQWPVQHWVALIERLQYDGLPVLLSGSPPEAALLAEIAGACRNAPPRLDHDLSVGRLAALFARARLVIGVDSGPLHIAVSQRTPSLHLFGPSDAQRFAPWGDPRRHRVLRQPLPCSPCGSLAVCPRATSPSECMSSLSPFDVYAAARQLLTEIT